MTTLSENRGSYPKANFTEEELDELKSCVIAVIDEGFTTPPYHDVFYDVIEKLEITQGDVYSYNISRPSPTSTKGGECD